MQIKAPHGNTFACGTETAKQAPGLAEHVCREAPGKGQHQ